MRNFCLLEKKSSITRYAEARYLLLENLVTAYLFCRVHNVHMINLEHLVGYYRGDGGEVELGNGVKLAVSRGRKEEFFKAVENVRNGK